MNAILKLTVFFGIFTMSIFCGCSNDNAYSPTSAEAALSEEALAKRLPSINEKNHAIKIASAFLKSQCVTVSNSEWGQSGTVTDAFPIYLPGVDEVSYYECKVTMNEVDAGYILVNTNQTDLPIPQYCTEGKTSSEEFALESGISIGDLQMFRYNCFEMFAEKKTSIGLGDGVPVVSRGFNKSGNILTGNKIDHQQMTTIRQGFNRRVQQAEGVNPLYLKTALKSRHNRDSLIAEALKKYPQGLSKTTYTDRWTNDELNNTFACGWHLPKWTQIRNASREWSGCAPLALTMLYAYSRQFRAKTLLFNGLDLNGNVTLPNGLIVNGSSMDASKNQIIHGVVWKIGADCGADYDTNGTSVDWDDLEADGELYGDQLGYNAALDVDYGGDFTKGKTALTFIQNEYPCMVKFYTDPPTNNYSHAAAIEGVKYQERKYIWNWYDREMWYLVNYGWGTTRQWICVDAQYGSNATEYKNTGNLYMVWY